MTGRFSMLGVVSMRMSDSQPGGREHLTTVPSLSGADYIRCMTCGNEAVTVGGLEHRNGCPEVSDGER